MSYCAVRTGPLYMIQYTVGFEPLNFGISFPTLFTIKNTLILYLIIFYPCHKANSWKSNSITVFFNLWQFNLHNTHIHNAFHYTSNCYIQLLSATSPASPQFMYSVDWRVWGGNISHVRTNFPGNERPELLVSYNVFAFKLGALWYVNIEGSVAVLKPSRFAKRQTVHWS